MSTRTFLGRLSFLRPTPAVRELFLIRLARKLWKWWQSPPPVGAVRFGSLRRTTPLSRRWGHERGQAVDRYYIENFLEEHRRDIRGRVLEVGDASYTRRFGGDGVTKSDVIHVTEGNPHATIVADLAAGDNIPSKAFDCIVLTQTLHLVYDISAAARTLDRILKPGGVLLLTVPGISQIDYSEWRDSWYWSFTRTSLLRVLQEHFPDSEIEIETHGNVLTSAAFLYGLSTQELKRAELDEHDPQYQMLITARVVKEHA
jgi:SAM-dependent methyltransferase